MRVHLHGISAATAAGSSCQPLQWSPTVCPLCSQNLQAAGADVHASLHGFVCSLLGHGYPSDTHFGPLYSGRGGWPAGYCCWGQAWVSAAVLGAFSTSVWVIAWEGPCRYGGAVPNRVVQATLCWAVHQLAGQPLLSSSPSSSTVCCLDAVRAPMRCSRWELSAWMLLRGILYIDSSTELELMPRCTASRV